MNSVLPTYPAGEVSQPADVAASRPGHSSGLRREAVTLGGEEQVVCLPDLKTPQQSLTREGGTWPQVAFCSWEPFPRASPERLR